jgi:hypothetical protein
MSDMTVVPCDDRVNDNRPPAPTPREADPRHYKSMPLHVDRLGDSFIAGQRHAEAFRCSWPGNAKSLAGLAGLGRRASRLWCSAARPATATRSAA